MNVVQLFRCFSHVREATGTNDGAKVEAIQIWCGGKKGDSWCADCVTMALDMYFRGFLSKKESPIPRTGSCDEIYKLAKEKKWLTETPKVGNLYLFMNGEDAHHVGMVMAILENGRFMGGAGNTSEDGKSSNGTGWFEHPFTYPNPKIKFVDYPQ